MGRHSYNEIPYKLTARGWKVLIAAFITVFILGLVGNWAIIADWR